MKVVFVGPTVPNAAALAPDLTIRPPARQGDIFRAVMDGASGIGLIDGYFEFEPAVWHKEILFALSCAARVAGAASMGALRAAECATFGMEPVGVIAESYRTGERLDDSDVAQIHAPEELGYLALCEPLVNVEATLAHMRDAGEIDADGHDRLLAAARRIFFKDRTWHRIVAESAVGTTLQGDDLVPRLRASYHNQKRQDGIALLQLVQSWTDHRRDNAPEWTLNQVQSFRSLMKLKQEL